MTLVVFDLDGTLLNAESTVTPFTAETLRKLGERGIAYTVATGRTLQAARGPIAAHGFVLPQIVKNGAVIWHPGELDYSHRYLLTQQELWHVLAAFTLSEISPFVFTLENNGRHAVYHSPHLNTAEQKLASLFEDERNLPLQPLSDMPADAHVINVSALGEAMSISTVIESLEDEEHLVSYTGKIVDSASMRWLDIHHSLGSKGNAVTTLREELGYDRIVVFGDGENDLSMFDCADESYAPSNADDEIKAKSTTIIGHHNEDGIARFLRERFDLD